MTIAEYLGQNRLIIFATICGLLALSPEAVGEDSKVPDTSASGKVTNKNYRMGVSTHFGGWWDPVPIVPLIDDLGVGWVRDDFLAVDIPEVSPGKFEVNEKIRKWIDLVSSKGIKILACLNENTPAEVKSQGRTLSYLDPDAFARRAAFLAVEFKGKIHCIEVLNEPPHFGFMTSYDGFWNGKASDGSTQEWIKKYVILLNKTADAVAAVNPDVKVVGMGSMPVANHRMLKEGVSPNVAGVTDHPYSFNTVPEIVPFASNSDILKRDGFATGDAQGTLSSVVKMYRDEMARSKGPKELWFTEWGFTSFLEGKGEPPSRLHKSGVSQMYSSLGQRAQACYILRRYVECLALGIEVSIQYDFKNDGDDPYEPESNFGLVDWHLKPKLSYRAVGHLAKASFDLVPTHELGVKIVPFSDDRQDPRPITWDGIVILRTPGSISSYEFSDPEGNKVLAIWSAERAGSDLSPRSADIEITTGSPGDHVFIRDLMTGDENRFEATPRSKGLLLKMVSVPDYPIFIKIPTADSSSPIPAPASLLDSTKTNWIFSNGAECPPPSQGVVEIRNLESGPQLDLAYNFSSGGTYAAAVNSGVNYPSATDFRFSAKVSSSCRMFLRLVDKSGETFQFSIVYDSPDKWRDYRKDIVLDKNRTILGGGVQVIFGGDSNKHFDLPVTGISLGIENPLGSLQPTEGVAEFRELSFGE